LRRFKEGPKIGFNKAKGRMFKSVGWTWNPITGCTHDCKYCWAESLTRRWGKEFVPTFRVSYLNDQFPNDGTWIFVGSMGDLFCDGIKTEDIVKVLEKIKTAENNIFLLQTKNPSRFQELPIYRLLEELKDKIVLGTTLETNWDTSEFSKAPPPYDRAYSLINAKKMGFKTFLSLEPLSKFQSIYLKQWIMHIKPEAIEIGLENYTEFTTRPSDEDILDLLDALDRLRIPYILKENLDYLQPQATANSQQIRINPDPGKPADELEIAKSGNTRGMKE